MKRQDMFTQTDQEVLGSKEAYLPPRLRTVVVAMEEGIASTSAPVDGGGNNGGSVSEDWDDEGTIVIDVPWTNSGS